MGLLVNSPVLSKMIDKEAVGNPIARLVAVEDVLADMLHAVLEVVVSITAGVGILGIKFVEIAVEP